MSVIATCDHCGRPHERKNQTQRAMCSQACRQAAYRDRRRAELAELRAEVARLRAA